MDLGYPDVSLDAWSEADAEASKAVELSVAVNETRYGVWDGCWKALLQRVPTFPTMP